MQILNNAWARIGLAVVALSAAALVAAIVRGSGEADAPPGRVEQSASATDAGIIVEAHRADFSGLAVDIELSVRAVDDALAVEGISPKFAEMAEVAVTSAHVRNDGLTILRFPAEAWPVGASTAQLLIHEVTIETGGGGLEPLAGDWELTIELPQGEQADAVRAVEALEPVVVELGGQQITLETFMTDSATLVRHEPREGPIVHLPPPTLRVGTVVLEATQSGQRGSVIEHWYGPVAQDDSLTLSFNGVTAIDPGASPWTLELTLDPDSFPSRSSDLDGVLEQELGWRVDEISNGPVVLDVEFRRRLDDVRLIITLDGSSWRPGPTPPAVLGDGAEMEVIAAGMNFPVNGPAESVIGVRLNGSTPPRTLLMTSAEAVVALPRTEAVLRP